MSDVAFGGGKGNLPADTCQKIWTSPLLSKEVVVNNRKTSYGLEFPIHPEQEDCRCLVYSKTVLSKRTSCGSFDCPPCSLYTWVPPNPHESL